MAPHTDIDTPEAARAAAAALLGDEVQAVDRRAGGGNNRLYRVEAADGRHYALKSYMHRGDDERDRLGAEFGGLVFLRAQGIRGRVPNAVARDPVRHCALFDWIDGEPVGRPAPQDLFEALIFVLDLYRLAQRPEAAILPLASEACLSAAELTRQIDRRMDRLLVIDDQRLRRFLIDDFAPAYERCCDEAAVAYEARDFDFQQSIAHRHATLSPSDFGFHNALRRADGRLVFIDFEYFGWDDPVKLVADFMLHPGMTLDGEFRGRFRRGAVAVFGGDPDFEWRLRLLYPLYAMRWCMILLNEFLPERWARRDYAGGHGQREHAQTAQLAKAVAMLRRVNDSYEEVIDHA
ncbi:MAG: phosphotransferase [Alphaproteobacteria bacterium]|nr:phosphotransferase [Alphaproteobacteria bacterium]MDP6815019.1 phosphotransferase [Alphaproteobacteria bacterium]